MTREVGVIVGLFGVCAKNFWRDPFIEYMEAVGLDRSLFFNPVLPPGVDWSEEFRLAEEKAKSEADYLVFYIGNTYDVEAAGNTLPFYSGCEVWDAMINDPKRAVVIIDYKDVTGHPAKQLKGMQELLIKNFGSNRIFTDQVAARRFFAKEVSRILTERIAKLTQTLNKIRVEPE
jgi:hypothetical protein